MVAWGSAIPFFTAAVPFYIPPVVLLCGPPNAARAFSFSHHSSPLRELLLLLFQFYRWGNWEVYKLALGPIDNKVSEARFEPWSLYHLYSSTPVDYSSTSQILICVLFTWWSFYNADADWIGLVWSWWFAILVTKDLGDADAAGQRTTLWLARLQRQFSPNLVFI